MKIERQFESKNYVVRISVESKNVHGHSTLTNHAEPTRRTLTEAARMYGEIHEDLFTRQWGGELQTKPKPLIEYRERIEPYGSTQWPNDVDPVVE